MAKGKGDKPDNKAKGKGDKPDIPDEVGTTVEKKDAEGGQPKEQPNAYILRLMAASRRKASGK